MEKLTLSVDPAVVKRAKRYAAARGTSVSRLVETMLEMVSAGVIAPIDPPAVLARLKGSMKQGAESDYKAYLQKKFR